MSEIEVDELVLELSKLCFTVSAGMYYSENCLELDDVVDLLREKLIKE
jgi:hypothetical protein